MSAPAKFGLPPHRTVLPDGQRRHFQHGPIDLVLQAYGPADETSSAYEQAWARFRTILNELVGELTALRKPVGECEITGAVAQSMCRACLPHTTDFVTPMAAVAGAVADAVLDAMTTGRRLDKAYVNNGGDIAVYLAAEEHFVTGIVTLGSSPALTGFSRIAASDPIRGIATSGWRGRSFSLGIADSVTVLARSAAEADVAATLIANAVNVEDPAIRRTRATDLTPDCDLGNRLVTVDVGPLLSEKVASALHGGRLAASRMWNRGLILDALITLQGRTCVIGRACADAA